MLKRGQKFHSFEHKITQFHKSKLQIILEGREKDTSNQYTQEYKSLAKAKADIEKTINNSLNGCIVFSKIIESGFLPKKRDLIKFEDTEKMLSILSDYDFRGKSVEIKNRHIHEQTNFISDIFSEQRLEEIFDSIFAFNEIRITRKHKKKKEYDEDGNEKKVLGIFRGGISTK